MALDAHEAIEDRNVLYIGMEVIQMKQFGLFLQLTVDVSRANGAVNAWSLFFVT
jgi:hypothetical protein